VTRYREADLGRVRKSSIQSTPRKVRDEMRYRPPTSPASFGDLWDGLPDVLAARDLRRLVGEVLELRRGGHPCLLFLGGHVVKTGLVPAIVQLLEHGVVTLVASHGAGMIHDVEISLFGRTSEDVAARLQDGSFGMDRETSELINGWVREAAAAGEGLGEGVGRRLLERLRAQGRDPDGSWLAAAYARGIPATLHVALGTDIVHQHGEADGASYGETSLRDFRILAGHLEGAAEVGVLNWGSAVLLPEVFLKALSVARNLSGGPRRVVAAVFDFALHYRPRENVVRRPTEGEGWGTYLVGPHEILVPLFLQGLLLERERLSGGD
jgi:hypothetical protein